MEETVSSEKMFFGATEKQRSSKFHQLQLMVSLQEARNIGMDGCMICSEPLSQKAKSKPKKIPKKIIHDLLTL